MKRLRVDRYPAAVQAQIAAQLYRNEDHPDRQLPHAVAERHEAPALGATIRGEAAGLCRTRIRFVGYRVQPLDPDNFAGSVKDLLDGLRHAELLLDDNPEHITLETEQVRVAHRKDEKTVIEIEPLSPQ